MSYKTTKYFIIKDLSNNFYLCTNDDYKNDYYWNKFKSDNLFKFKTFEEAEQLIFEKNLGDTTIIPFYKYE